MDHYIIFKKITQLYFFTIKYINIKEKIRMIKKWVKKYVLKNIDAPTNVEIGGTNKHI